MRRASPLIASSILLTCLRFSSRYALKIVAKVVSISPVARRVSWAKRCLSSGISRIPKMSARLIAHARSPAKPKLIRSRLSPLLVRGVFATLTTSTVITSEPRRCKTYGRSIPQPTLDRVVWPCQRTSTEYSDGEDVGDLVVAAAIWPIGWRVVAMSADGRPGVR